jgi:hypothetical protein
VDALDVLLEGDGGVVVGVHVVEGVEEHVGVAADLDLDGLEAARDVAADLLHQLLGALAAGVEAGGGVGVEGVAVGAEEAVDGGVGGLANDVPEGYVDAGDAHHEACHGGRADGRGWPSCSRGARW